METNESISANCPTLQKRELAFVAATSFLQDNLTVICKSTVSLVSVYLLWRTSVFGHRGQDFNYVAVYGSWNPLIIAQSIELLS